MRAGECPFKISHLTVAAYCYDVTEQFFRQTAPFVVPTRNEQMEMCWARLAGFKIQREVWLYERLRLALSITKVVVN
jgi:hypothetical protein